MKKLRLNKLFHWLYAILMLYPVVFGIGGLLVSIFSSFQYTTDFPDIFNNVMVVVGENCLNSDYFFTDTLGFDLVNSVFSVINFFGFDLTDSTFPSFLVASLFNHWVIVSLFYLIFDVLMYPINLFHKWIDDGGF